MVIVIFGASGDLSKRKLFPALSKLILKDTLIIGYSRANLAPEFHERLLEHYHYTEEFLKNVVYCQGEYNDLSPLYIYKDTEIIFYLSLPPSVYPTLISEMKKFSNAKIVLEKPFGSSFENFKDILGSIEAGKMENIYFVDHYLLKPMCVVMSRIKQELTQIDHILSSSKYHEYVHIVSKEELGIEGRSYFNETGIIRDMVQNHLLALYATFFIRYDKVNNYEKNGFDRYDFIKDMSIYKDRTLIGQYKGYKNELQAPSDTETYCICIFNNSYAGHKVIFTCGKGLNSKKTEVRIKLKKSHIREILNKLFHSEKEYELVHKSEIQEYFLVFNITPSNSIYLELTYSGKKRKIILMSTDTITKFYSDEWSISDNHSIIFDSLVNNKPFSHTNIKEAKKQWELFHLIGDEKRKDMFIYDKGIDIPREARKMLADFFESNK